MKRKQRGQSHKPHWACHTPVTDVTGALLGEQSSEEEVWQQPRQQQLWPSRPSPFPRSTHAQELGKEAEKGGGLQLQLLHGARLCGIKDLLPMLREAQAPVLEIFLHLGKQWIVGKGNSTWASTVQIKKSCSLSQGKPLWLLYLCWSVSPGSFFFF